MRTRELRTRRLRLEPLERRHAGTLFELLQESRLHEWTSRGAPPSLEQFERDCVFLQGLLSLDGSEHWLNWVVALDGSCEIVGKLEATIERTSRRASLAYFTFGSHVRKGFATEAAGAVIEHLFNDWGAASVTIKVDVENAASISVAERLGAARVCRKGNATFHHGTWHDDLVYEVPRPP